MKRFCSVLLALVLLLTLALPVAAAEESHEVTVLFTHDLHSHLQPANDDTGSSYGGFARLKTVIDAQKALYPDAVLLDGGDFSMGSLFQTIYATDAAELRMMGAMGYDVTTFGNHEYDYRASGFAAMLNAAADSGERLPQLVEANYKPPVEGSEAYDESAADVWDAFARLDVQDYTVIERGGVNIAVLGIYGKDADSCAPMSGMELADPIETAKAVVARIEAEVPQPRLVVALSHSGTWADPDKSEDEQLAAAVPGIDLIISGHTHTRLDTPIQVGDTYVVSCGEYSKNLGVVQLTVTEEKAVITDYLLIPIDDTVAEDPGILAEVERFKGLVEENYLSRFGDWTYDTVLAYNPVAFESTDELGEHKEARLGNLISDAYIWAVQQSEGVDYVPVDFAVTAKGVIRESLAAGALTVADVFNVESLGIGPDEVPGYPLVSVWLTGKDLKNALEVDASVVSLMPSAQLYFSGAAYTANTNRMLLNRVHDCALVKGDNLEPIENDKLYRVVTGLYSGQMLGWANDLSYGLLAIVPRYADGTPVEDIEDCIIHNADGTELKEWYAVAAYLQDMGTVSDYYETTHGRKVLYSSWNPVSLLTGANWITYVVLAVIVLLVLLAVLILRAVVRKVRK